MYSDRDFADAIQEAQALLAEASATFVQLVASPRNVDEHLRQQVKTQPQLFDQLIQAHGHEAVQKWLGVGNGSGGSGVGGRPPRISS